MQIHPYSIYIDHRPYRIAFLVDSSKGTDWLDKIFDFNKEKWGGRHNPIIVTDGKEISEDWWSFLRDYDPDIIFSTVKLNEDIQRKIQIFLSPLRVENIDGNTQHINFHDDPISILPTHKNVLEVTWGLMDSGSSLVLFELEKSTPLEIQNFLKRTFGVYELGQMMPYHLKKSLKQCPVKRYPIKDYTSLNNALLDLGEFRNNVVFPIQLCSLPNINKDIEYNYNNEKFTIIVGDSTDDLITFWNTSLRMSHWLRKYFTHMWIPTQMMNNNIVKPGLEKFINRFTSQTGNNNNQGARLISHSVDKSTLDSYVNQFKKIWHPKTTQVLTKPELPNFQNNDKFFLKQGLELFRAHSSEEHIVINEPNIKEGGMGGQSWFIDLYIQFRPERFTNIIGTDFWWQLPQRNSILYETKFVNKPARINDQGMLSVLMQRKSSFHPDENKLVIKIPDDKDIFHSLICGESYDNYSKDQGDKFRSRPFYQMQRSDKGMYLTGLLSLFPDLSYAYHIFQKRYWRRIFKLMANQDELKDQILKTEVMNRLKKHINKGRDFQNSVEDREWLAEQVINLSRRHAKHIKDLTFRQLVDEAEEEIRQYNEKQENNQVTLNPNDLREEVSSMLVSNILLLGLIPRCPRCGYRIWYPISEISQTISCEGCNNTYSMDAEQTWFYRLNSLVRDAVSQHGIIPVLLILGQLMNRFNGSFMFFPSANLFTKPINSNSDPELDQEVDLLCLQNGKFIIGEIKQSVKSFQPLDFEKMEKLAKLIKPDKIIFSSIDKIPNKTVRDGINGLKKSLKDLEIDIDWYPLYDYFFEPSPPM